MMLYCIFDFKRSSRDLDEKDVDFGTLAIINVWNKDRAAWEREIPFPCCTT